MRETLNHEQATKLQTEEEKNTKNELVKLGEVWEKRKAVGVATAG